MPAMLGLRTLNELTAALDLNLNLQYAGAM